MRQNKWHLCFLSSYCVGFFLTYTHPEGASTLLHMTTGWVHVLSWDHPTPGNLEWEAEISAEFC
jgi:hypothetical protein